MNFQRLLLLCAAATFALAPACNCDPGDGPDGGGPPDSGAPDSGNPNPNPPTDSGYPYATPDGGCGLQTCATMDAYCGPIGDGCGAILDCGPCTAPQTCGGGGVRYRCGGAGPCVPRDCSDVGATCGPISDGCGNLVDCGGCDGGQTCGGAGQASVCGGGGGPGTGPDAGLYPDGGCRPRSCFEMGANCGQVGDGCGGTTPVCGTCSGTETCGGSGTPSVCGTPASACVPRDCADAGLNCGPYADGCGNLLNCGSSCSSGTCGGAGMANVCGGTAPPDGGFLSDGGCRPRSCLEMGVGCGPSGDGCGGTIASCGGCDGGASCGASGSPGVCGLPPNTCMPLSCVDMGLECGWAGDGCGNAVQCGVNVCDGGSICGGNGVPNMCGLGDAGTQCTNLCPYQSMSNTLTGVVYMPTNPDAGFGPPPPLPNVFVYVPNGTIDAFPEGVSCDICGATASGQPLRMPDGGVMSAVTNVDGGFTLTNIPVPPDGGLPLVMQLGRWRRQVVIPVIAGANIAPAAITRMPRNRFEGDIPRIAMVTGDVDVNECVLRKMGIADSEFTQPDAGGRIDLYRDHSCDQAANPFNPACAANDMGGGARLPDGGWWSEGFLTATQSRLNQYDMVILACRGFRSERAAGDIQRVINYANAGGRVYGTHFSYSWFYDGGTDFSKTADWQVGQGSDDNLRTIKVNTSIPKGALLAQWLYNTGATSDAGWMPLGVLRRDFNLARPPSENWLTWELDAGATGPASPWPIHYTFNTPTDAGTAPQCGKVIYSDFHVTNHGGSHNINFPNECTVGPMTAQEKVLAFMLFDLSSCVQQSGGGPVCAPKNCAQQGFFCGWQGDGCGNQIFCGGCDAGSWCGGNGQPSVCGAPACQTVDCATLGIECGPAGNGCGGSQDCGPCDVGTCGGGGFAGVCGVPNSCPGVTCGQQNLFCGPAGDGCGNVIQCGGCDGGTTCGGAGVPGVCGAVACASWSCEDLGFECGPAGDGCGSIMQCGSCDVGTCGGGGFAGVCGTGSSCLPLTCAQQGLQCGPAGDGCGNVIQCGGCDAGTCGGIGIPGVCGSPCVPQTCASQNAECGVIGDGCGNVIQCGGCDAGTCGGLGTPNVCGDIG